MHSALFFSGAKKGLVVAKKLAVNDFWLIVNGGGLVVNTEV